MAPLRGEPGLGSNWKHHHSCDKAEHRHATTRPLFSERALFGAAWEWFIALLHILFVAGKLLQLFNTKFVRLEYSE